MADGYDGHIRFPIHVDMMYRNLKLYIYYYNGGISLYLNLNKCFYLIVIHLLFVISNFYIYLKSVSVNYFRCNIYSRFKYFYTKYS